MDQAEYKKYLRSKHWKAFRAKVLDERGRRCEICRIEYDRCDVHHLHYQTVGRESPEDVQVLCRGDHTHEHELRPGMSTFNTMADFRAYLKTLSPRDLNRRFPKYWIPLYLRGEQAEESPDSGAIVNNGHRKHVLRKPRTDPGLFAVLSAAGFKCQFCSKSLSTISFQVSAGKATCGCNLLKDFRERSRQ